MNGFKEYLYVFLGTNNFIEEDSELCVEDMTVETITGETSATEDDINDAWCAYIAECAEDNSDPVNDVEDFEEP